MEQELKIDPDPLPALRVGIFYTLKKGIKSQTADTEAEYDSIDTVNAIKASLQKLGNRVFLFEVGKSLFENLEDTPIDVAFNISEGISGRGREAQIPALLDMLGIPYVGSDPTTLCVALDKALTKRVLSAYGVRSPRSAIITKENLGRPTGLTFPVIVKPNSEGSSKGISDVSIVKNERELSALAEKNIVSYGSDMLAEEYLSGREFTVGIVGNGADTEVFPPMEIIYRKPTQENFTVYSYSVKQNYKQFIDYKCPPDLPAEKIREITDTALKIYASLQCRDFARVDFRMDGKNNLYFLEINPLPGLAPGYSDFPMLAEFSGISYDELIKTVFGAAVKRLTNEKRLGGRI